MYSKSNQFLARFLFGIILVFILSLANSAPASETPDTVSYENLDARWLPWVGSWSLVSNKINTKESTSTEKYFLTISPGSSENSITMKGQQGDKVLVEEEMIADGLRHPLKDEKCSGYYIYSWSENGKRLLLESESNCPGDPTRRVSGMSIIDANRDWVDIQLLQNGKNKAISIRKYRNIDNNELMSSGRFNPDQINMARISAANNFSINEMIELSNKVESEVLEAALLEMRKPFPINSKQLTNLADSGVNPRVVDLMVALSFPDKFSVEQEVISLTQGGNTRVNFQHFRYPYNYYSYYCPILPWHWTSSSYMSYAYGYSYMGWYVLDGYYYYPLWAGYPYDYPYYYDYYGGGGGGGTTLTDNGVMINGRGYSRVTSDGSGSPRYAKPRSNPSSRGVPVRSRAYSSSSSSPLPSSPPPSSTSSSGGSSSSYSGGSTSVGSVSTSSSSSGSPTASPSGYSSGRH